MVKDYSGCAAVWAVVGSPEPANDADECEGVVAQAVR